MIGCLLGGSWREKVIVCKLPGAPGVPNGLPESRPGSIWELFCQLAVEKRVLQKTSISLEENHDFSRSRRPWGRHFSLPKDAKAIPGVFRDSPGRELRLRSLLTCLWERLWGSSGANKKLNGCLLGGSWRQKLFVCKLPRAPGASHGLPESLPGSIWELFCQLAVEKLVFQKTSVFLQENHDF